MLLADAIIKRMELQREAERSHEFARVLVELASACADTSAKARMFAAAKPYEKMASRFSGEADVLEEYITEMKELKELAE